MALHQANQNGISQEEYLADELISQAKHEYIDGEVYAMAGASANHGRLRIAPTSCGIDGSSI